MINTNLNTYYTPDEKLILTFMQSFMPNYDSCLGYHKWHYVKGFTKNCGYNTAEYYQDVKLMRKLEKSVDLFQRKYYKDCDLSDININTKRQRLSNKTTIFLYWHQGKDNLPDLQKLCYQRLIQKCSKKFNILMLDYSDIKKYIDIPDIIETAMLEKRMWLQHFVDYVRIALLSKYEGIWFDATIFARDDLQDVDFSNSFWSIKCMSMFKNTWAQDVIPEMLNCQIYAMSGTSAYFYSCMKRLIEYHFEKFNIAYSYYMMYYIAQYLYTTNNIIKQQFDSLAYNNEHVECFANNRSLSLKDITNLWHVHTDTHLFKLIKFKTEQDDAYKVYLFLKDIYDKETSI